MRTTPESTKNALEQPSPPVWSVSRGHSEKGSRLRMSEDIEAYAIISGDRAITNY